MFCSKCGEKLEDAVVFCPKCGTKVVSDTSGIGQPNVQVSNYPVPSTTDMSKLIMVLAGIFILASGTGLILYGINLNNNVYSQLSSLFYSGSTKPGTGYIFFGILGIVAGLVLFIIGLTKKSANSGVARTQDPKKNKLAIVSLISGIASFIGIPFGLPIALITGILGLKSTKRNMAVAGLALSILNLILLTVLLYLAANGLIY